MSLKQINVKQAERWLQKLKNQNLQSYKDITKFLRKYEKTEDQYDCYVKISHTLLAHSELTKELNNYMEEVNKFVVNKPEDQKIKEFMAFVKKSRPDVFERIIQMIQDLSKSKGENPVEISKSLRPRLRDIVQGDPQLERITQEALDLTGQELITRKNLEHLKAAKPTVPIVDEEKETVRQQPKQTTQRANKNHENQGQTYTRQPGNRFTKPLLIGPFTNPSEEKNIIRQIEKSVDQQTYCYILKIIRIFYLNIITRNQAFDLLAGIQVDQLYMQCIKDIIDTRETQRRKVSCFRPLNDMSFSNSQRASPSYVAMPQYYPIRSQSKPDWIKSITNEKWVSVPHGSEESENFSVRNKNINEINLLKAEDERYEFDLYVRKLRKTVDLLNQIIDPKNVKSEQEQQKIVSEIIQMRTLQIIFKNCLRDQKDQLQFLLKTDVVETCTLFKQRVEMEINQLTNIRDVHANKSWSEIATKNFFKALDLKGFQFKKNQKQKMKSAFFMSQLQQRSKLLQNGGEVKNSVTFNEKKQFFTVLNSFQSSSRTERCVSRQIPAIQQFDISNQRNRHLYPLIILTFQDQSTCQKIYSLLLFYIDNFPMSEPEKLRCKIFLEEFFIHFLGWKHSTKQYLNEQFDQQKFYSKINGSEELINLQEWISEQKQEPMLIFEEKQEEYDQQKSIKSKMGFLKDSVSEYSYLPAKNQNKCVLYGSEQLYSFTRFVYALYERLIKMQEVAQNTEKIQLFYILFFSCIKAKEGSKFQQNLNILFGKHAYLFSTLYKLLDNLIKSLSLVSACPLMNYSFKCSKQPSEDLHFVMINRFCLTSNLTNHKLIRLTYDTTNKVIYFNYIDSYYKSDEFGKDIVKKRSDIAKGIQIYTVDSFGLTDKKKRKANQIMQNNEIQYIFQGSTIKMLNHREREDLMLCGGKRVSYSKNAKRQLKRAYRLMLKIN